MKPTHAILIVGVLLIAALLFLGRYQLIPGGEFSAFRIDKWTGEVRLYNLGGWRTLGPLKGVGAPSPVEPTK